MHFPNKATICYLINDDNEVLLQCKSKGFGKGKWNGPGGKIEAGETPKACVKREVLEETGVKIIETELWGKLEFIFPYKPEDNFYSYVFVCRDFRGIPADKGEGELRWFSKEKIPWKKMWDDDKYWLDKMLGGEFVEKRFYFNKDGYVDSCFNLEAGDKVERK